MTAIPFTPLRASDVVCPRCGAEAETPCRRADGEPAKNSHTERVKYAQGLNERATGSDPQARWHRHHLRAGHVPRPPQPCGTWGAYKRHLRHGEPACDKCVEAARRQWRERKSRA